MKRRMIAVLSMIVLIVTMISVPAYATVSPSENEAYNYLANLAVNEGEYVSNEAGQGAYLCMFEDEDDYIYTLGFKPQDEEGSPLLSVTVESTESGNDVTGQFRVILYMDAEVNDVFLSAIVVTMFRGEEQIGEDSGYAYLIPATYQNNTELTLETFTNEDLKETAQRIMNGDFHLIMEFLHTMLGQAGYTLADLGFTSYVIECTGEHAWDSGKLTIAPTCTGEGLYTYICTVCGAVGTRAVPAKGHSWNSGTVTYDPQTGLPSKIVYTCTECGETKVSDRQVPNPFQDVADGAFYYTPVLWAVNHQPQITNGTSATAFSPNATCTRGQVVTFLWRAMNCPEPKSTTNPFTDVKAGDYFYKAVLWAAENGITTGTSKTTFSPGSPCTRAHVVTFLWRAHEKPSSGNSNPFKDVAAGQYYTSAVLWAVSRNITNGLDATHFGPNNPCTRGQIVTFLYRDMK